MTKQEYAEYQERVEAELKSLKYASSGYCPGCAVCEDAYGAIEEEEDYPEVEGSFSWQSCEICGSGLGGDRHPVHAVAADGSILHFDACIDCVYYMEYGRLDDMTMLDMEKEEC